MVSANIHDFLVQKFPEYSNLEVLNLENITSGWETEILSFDVELSRSGETKKRCWISRAYPGDSGVRRAQTEYNLLQSLYSMKFPVPEVILVETDSSWLGKPFIIMERIDGPTMENLLETAGEKRRIEIIQRLCELAVRIHSLDWSKIQMDFDKYYSVTPDEMFLRRLDDYQKWVSESGVQYLLPLVEWMKQNHHTIIFEKYSLLHGDFHPMNILIDSNDEPFVIDWTAARIGDYRSDLAWSIMLAYVHSEYPVWQLIQREYEKASGHSIKNINYFLVEASIRRFADIFISLSAGAESLGMLEETESTMLSSITLLTKLHDLVEGITGLRIKEIDDTIQKLSHSM
ncbi:MAG: phosphotransferase family protein [Candidatus Thorarchaeota archaeon]